mgnify:CR=1 FL=1
MTTKEERRLKIKAGVRGKISGTPERPRLTVFRSNKQIYAQVIDDTTGKTLAAASSFDRNGYLYHGRIKELADAARNGGLKF